MFQEAGRTYRRALMKAPNDRQTARNPDWRGAFIELPYTTKKKKNL